MTIRRQLTLQFFLLVLGILGVSTFTVFYVSEQHRKEDFYDRLKSKAESTARLLLTVDEVDIRLLQRIERNNPMSLPDEGIRIWNQKNELIFNTDRKNSIKADSLLLDKIRLEKEWLWEEDGFEKIGFIYGGNFVVLAAAHDVYGKRRIDDLKWVLLLVCGVSLIFILLSGWLFAGRAMLPIAKIIDRVKQISIQSLNLRLEEGNKVDELSQLAQTFNNMLDRLESGVKIQKDFIANASHEMRTPLTAITGQLEVVLLSERTAERYKTVIRSVLEDIKNLNLTSNRLLLLAQANTENLKLETEPIRIDELVWQCVEDLRRLQPHYHVEVEILAEIDDEKGLEIPGNIQLLKTAISNLMENGCKYSDDHWVQVRLESEKNGLRLIFSDNGIGIPPTDLPQIFEPFYRASNTGSSRGHGIGLSIVKRVIEVHKGKIKVESELGKGTRFTVFLPY